MTDSVRSDPSRTRRALEARRPQRQTQQDAATRQSSAMRVKAHRVLSAFQGSIGGHAATIQSLCAQVTTAKLRKAAEINQLALDIRAELEAIIAQVQAGTGGIGNCGNGPVPSQGYGNPPSYVRGFLRGLEGIGMLMTVTNTGRPLRLDPSDLDLAPRLRQHRLQRLRSLARHPHRLRRSVPSRLPSSLARR